MSKLAIQQTDNNLNLLKEVSTYRNNHQLTEILTAFLPKDEHISFRDCYFFKLTEVSYDDEYPRREAFENVLATLDNPSFNFVYFISGKPDGIHIYLGVVRNLRKKKAKLSAADYAIDILNATLTGNFQGSELVRLKRQQIQEDIFEPMQLARRFSLITGIPSLNEDQTNEQIDFQGIDRLIHSMTGTEWQFMVVCEPMDETEIDQIKNEVYELYNDLYRFSKSHCNNPAVRERVYLRQKVEMKVVRSQLVRMKINLKVQPMAVLTQIAINQLQKVQVIVQVFQREQITRIHMEKMNRLLIRLH